jgi:hypothetical protein
MGQGAWHDSRRGAAPPWLREEAPADAGELPEGAEVTAWLLDDDAA